MKKGLGINLSSIRSKLIVSLTMMCMIPLIVLGVFSLRRSTDILSNQLEKSSSQTLIEINNSMNNYFNLPSSFITMLAGNINFEEADNNAAEFLKYASYSLDDVQKSNDNILNAYYGTESGKFIIAPHSDMGADYNHKVRPWYQLALKNAGKTVITPPFKDVQTGNQVVSVAKTVQKEGKVVGVVAMNVSLDTLKAELSKSKIGDTGYVYIADLDGVLISHPDSKLIGTNTPAQLSFWGDVKKNESGFVQYDYEGEKRFGAYTTNKSTGWKMVAALRESELTKNTNSIKYMIIILIAIVMLIAVALSLLISGSIASNVKKLKNSFEKASEGDLTTKVSINSKDEFGDLGSNFNLMMDKIVEVLRSVSQSSKTVLETSTNLACMAEQTTSSVGEVSRAIEEISEGANKQAYSSQDGASAVNDLASRLDEISRETQEMDEISSSTRNLSDTGLGMVRTLMEKSEQTKMSSSQVSEIVKAMYDSTAQISTISNTISQITAQTNLLSLNASIEAARAGEAGRGFSVVADEIRKLAEQSNESTKEIKKIIEDIQSKSVVAVKAMEESGRVVEEQDKAVFKTQEIFNQITSAIAVLIERVTGVRDSVLSTGTQKEKLVEQIENMSSVSQETASATEEVTASTEEINATMDEFTKYAEELQRLSEKLEKEVGRFRLN